MGLNEGEGAHLHKDTHNIIYKCAYVCILGTEKDMGEREKMQIKHQNFLEL